MLQCNISNWSQDHFALGAYVSLPNPSAYDLELLSHPVGSQILFAGEATSKSHFGTVRGAMYSGFNEALRLLGRSTIHFAGNLSTSTSDRSSGTESTGRTTSQKTRISRDPGIYHNFKLKRDAERHYRSFSCHHYDCWRSK